MPLTAALLAAEASPQQVTIEDTGSTNRPGVKLIVTSTGAAQVEIRDAEARKTNIDTRLCDRLFQDLKSAGSLGGLPRTHCMKSVSFGSSLYMEFNGERSPDLSCPAAQDSKVAILQKDARDVMEAAHATPKMTPRTFIYTVPRK
jgi:hypothetical protein